MTDTNDIKQFAFNYLKKLVVCKCHASRDYKA